jgi:hypothetical protein
MRRNTLLLWLLIVFVSGAAVGAASYRYFAAERPVQEDRKPFSREQLRQEYLGKLKDRVGVSDEQLSQIVAILDEARATSDEKRTAFDADMKLLQNQVRERIRALMTPDQLSRYEAWRAERRREREKHDREHGDKDRQR